MLAFASVAHVPRSCIIVPVAEQSGTNLVMFRGLSPDGRSLALGWDRNTEAGVQRGSFLLDLRTGVRTALPALNNAPSFSHDGRFLVAANYSANPTLRTEIVELDLTTAKSRTFASNPAGEWLPSYSADDRWILFNSTRTGASDIYRARRSDGLVEQLTDDPRYEAHAQYFEGDRKLLFHRAVSQDNYDIIVRDAHIGSERSIRGTAAEESYPEISRDGRWIAFSAVSAQGSQPHLFVMRSDGSHRRQLTDDVAKDAYATWARNGRSIYFVRFAGTGSKIFRVDVRDGRCAA